MSSKLMTTRNGPADAPGSATQVFRLGVTASASGDIPADIGREDLIALVRSELRRSYAEGHPWPIEHFRDYLVEANVTDDDWLVLIAAELQLRHEFGPAPDSAEYIRRFPDLANLLPVAFGRAACHDGEQLAQRDGPSSADFLTMFAPQSGPSTMPCRVAGAITPLLAVSEVAIPGYEILGVLGRGGMGVVYQARQTASNRVVALKMVLAGSHADQDDLARFRQEAAAVAALKHPNIVEVYEIGEHEGRPFYSMEYVAGGNLAKKIAGQPQDPVFAAKIAEDLARAIHQAHRQNIIHRDLKPANILLDATSSTPLSARHATPDTTPQPVFPMPKITDFGLAKRLNSVLQLTTSGLVAGTPQYMAPEQMAPGRQASVGPATDIYAIGVVLYELLTGRPPFLGSGPAEIMHQVLRHEPVPIRQLQPEAPRALDTICLKCLQKEPFKRYATAEELADDLRRQRHDEPILARPVGKREQAVRWCRRNPTVASLLLLVIVTLALGTGMASKFAIDAAAQAQRAEAKEHEARIQEQAANQNAAALRDEKKAVEQAHQELTQAVKQLSAARQQEERLKQEAEEREKFRARELFDAEMVLAHRAWETGQVARTRRLLASYEPVRHDQPDHRGFEWHYLSRLSNSDSMRFAVPDGCHSIALSPDGKRLIWAFRDLCEIWDLTRPMARIGTLGNNPEVGHRGMVERVAYDPTGRLIATASRDKTIKLWDAKSLQLLRTIKAGLHTPIGLRFSPDGKSVAACLANKGRPSLPGVLCAWDAGSGESIWTSSGHTAAIYDLAYSADGQLIASAGYDECIKVWNAATGDAVASLPLPKNVAARVLAFAPQGPWLAAGTSRGEIRLWNRDTWKEERRFRAHLNWVYALAFSPDGASLASGGSDEFLKIWDVANGLERRSLRGHTGPIPDVAWAPAPGRPRVFSASLDESIKGWEIAQDPESFIVNTRSSVLVNFHLLADGRHLVAASQSSFVGLWDISTGKSIAVADFHTNPKSTVWSSSLAPDGQSLVFTRTTGGSDPVTAVLSWDLKSEAPVTLDLPDLAKDARQLAYSLDGKRLATGHADGKVQVHFLDRQKEPLTWQLPGRSVNDLLFQPGEPDHLLAVGRDVAPRLYDLNGVKLLRSFDGQSPPPRVAGFSADGKRLATGGNDHNTCVWDVATGRMLFKLEGHTAPVRSVVFSPDGERLLTGSEDFTVKLWDLRTGHETLTLRGHTNEVTQALFAPDGRRVLSAARDANVRVWDAGPKTDRELFRAAAAACRLASFQVEGPLQAGETATVQYELVNVSGRSWPVPALRKTPGSNRTVLRLFAERLREGIDPNNKGSLIGRTDFLPDKSIEVDEHRVESFSFAHKLSPGRYRLRLEHGWRGDEFVLIDEKSLDVTFE